MTVYFLLVAVIIFLPIFVEKIFGNSPKIRNAELGMLLGCVFILCALKSPNVGRDILGYKNIYDVMKYKTWKDFDVCYFEWGYEFLMMIFSNIFQMSFQGFMACVYSFVFYSYYLFIKRYSQDYAFSVLIYVCFTFLPFDMSAVRNMIGVAICLLAVAHAQKSGIKNAVIFFVIVIAAAQVHKSAYVFLVAYFVIKTPINKKTVPVYAGATLIILFLREPLYSVVDKYLKSLDEMENVRVGGSFLFYTAIVLMAYLLWVIAKKQYSRNENAWINERNLIDFKSINLSARLVYSGIIVQLFATGSVMIRLAAYLQIFLVILLPNCVCKLDRKSRWIVKSLFYVFLIWYFYKFSLATNELNMVPYTVYRYSLH